MRKSHGRMLRTSVAASCARYPTLRVGVFCAIGFVSALLAACGELEPMREPEVVDLQLTTDTLRTSVRDAQRMVAELRTDLESRRRELAEAQVARAQLEGRVREAERRVLEARQVIELQREELAAARIERARVSRSSFQSQNQTKPFQRKFSKAEQANAVQDQEAASSPSSGMSPKDRKATQDPVQGGQPSEYRETQQLAATPAAMGHVSVNRDPSSPSDRQRTQSRHVSVKPGDTLWSIAQKYRVSMKQLRALNQLPDNKIITGQALWLPDDSSRLGVAQDLISSTQ